MSPQGSWGPVWGSQPCPQRIFTWKKVMYLMTRELPKGSNLRREAELSSESYHSEGRPRKKTGQRPRANASEDNAFIMRCFKKWHLRAPWLVQSVTGAAFWRGECKAGQGGVEGGLSFRNTMRECMKKQDSFTSEAGRVCMGTAFSQNELWR